MKEIFSILFIIFALNNFLFSQDNTTDKINIPKNNKYLFNTNINYERNRFLSQDIIEWTSITGLTIFDGLFFHYYLQPEDKNLISDLDHSKEMKDEYLPTWIGLAGIGVVSSLILFLPNNLGFLNYEAYINLKGYCESIITTILITDILKFSIAEKRPDYESRLKTDDADTIKDGKLSFPSEHSSVAFATSTYLTFFLFQYLGDNKIPSVLSLKILLATGLNALSIGIAALRVIENKHYIQDVVVGGVIGIIVSSFFYCFHNYFGIYKKKIYENKKLSFNVEPDNKELGIDIVLRF